MKQLPASDQLKTGRGANQPRRPGQLEYRWQHPSPTANLNPGPARNHDNLNNLESGMQSDLGQQRRRSWQWRDGGGSGRRLSASRVRAPSRPAGAARRWRMRPALHFVMGPARDPTAGRRSVLTEATSGFRAGPARW